MSKFKVGDEVLVRGRIVEVNAEDDKKPLVLSFTHELDDIIVLSPKDLSAYTSHTSAEMVEWCGVPMTESEMHAFWPKEVPSPGCLTACCQPRNLTPRQRLPPLG